jgi:lysozyme family protein
MKQTYEEAITKVFKDEGGYTDDAADPGGPTNWGITIFDARMYWKPNATAADVKSMPKSVAEDIYRKHYANPIQYDSLPAGVDYAVLDYGINSGNSRSVRVLQSILNVNQDGVVGPVTIAAAQKHDPVDLIKEIYTQRLNFLEGLHTWSTFGKGWSTRCKTGLALALKLHNEYKDIKPTTPPTINPPSTEPKPTWWDWFNKPFKKG